MSSSRVDVFFYGLFMDEALLRSKGLNPQSPRIATLQDFELVIGERATLVPRGGATAYGIVFSLAQDELDKLYADPSVSVYQPETVTVQLKDGSVISALCYNLPNGPTGSRNEQYAGNLAKLAGRLGLPDHYISKIEHG